MPASRYPTLFQVNTRVRLSEIAAERGRKSSTLDDMVLAVLHEALSRQVVSRRFV